MARSLIAAAAVTLALSDGAAADTITIAGTDAVYGAGLSGPVGGSTAAEEFDFAPSAGLFITAQYLSGTTDCCGDNTPNTGPDGETRDVDIIALNGISGTKAPSRMFLAGVFVDSDALPTSGDTAPASLSFVGNTDFATLSPLLNQIFWIGDGLTGTGTGSTQKFFAPTGADRLLLGFTDAFAGTPGFYGDNTGALTMEITANTAPIPLPAGWPLLIAGLGGFALLRGKQR